MFQKESIFHMKFFLISCEIFLKLFLTPNGFSWNLGFFIWNQFLWKGLFYFILICQLVLPFFPGNLGMFLKQSSFSYFSYETFFWGGMLTPCWWGYVFVSSCWKATINLILGISSGVSFSFFCHYMMYTFFDNAAQKYFNSFHCVFLVFHVKNSVRRFSPTR